MFLRKYIESVCNHLFISDLELFFNFFCNISGNIVAVGSVKKGSTLNCVRLLSILYCLNSLKKPLYIYKKSCWFVFFKM